MQNQSPVSPSAVLALFAALGGSSAALAQTWSAPGDGNWSVSANWSPATVPITGNIATLGDTSSNRTITYDSAASGTVGTLTINQSSAASNSLLVSRSLTVQNAVTLGSSGGTAQINVGSNATTGFQLTSAGGITLNQGGVLGLSATTNTLGTGFQAGSLNANTALTISGGTLVVLGSTGNNTTAAASNTINGNLSMSSGSISFNNVTGTTADRRLDIRGPVVNITGGSLVADRASALLQFQSTANTSITLNPASFDSSRIGLNLQSDFVQTLTTNQTIGALSVRGSGVKTLTSTASGNGIGQLTFWDTNNATVNSAATLRLGSNLNLTSGAAQPVVSVTGGHSPESGRIDAAIDTNGFTLDLSAGASSGVWTPPASTQTSPAAVTNTVWSLSGNGSIRANAFNLGAASVTTNVGSGLVLNAVGGNSTASNLGSTGAINSGSTFRYSGAASTATPATLTFARNIGQVEVTSGTLRILSGASGNITGISVSGGTLDLNSAARSFDTISLTGGTLAGGNYSLTSGNFTGLQTGTVSAQLSGPSSLVKNTPGTLTLAGNNNFGLGGSVTITQGTIVAGHVNAFGSTSQVIVNGGDADLGGLSINKIFRLDANGGSISNGTIARNNVNNVNFAWQAGSVSASITEAGGGIVSINKTSNGTLVLSGNNSHSGNTTVSAGTLLVRNSTGSGTGTGQVFVNSGATLGGNGTISGATTLNSGTIGSTGETLSLGSTLATTGSSTLASGSTVNVTGGSSITSGTFTVNGTLGGGINVGGAGNTLNGSGTVNGTTSVNGGTIDGTLNLATLVATGNSIIASSVSASSGTTVSSGALTVSGSLGGGAVTIQSGATLKGSGVVNGATTIQSGGFLAPGNSPGILEFSNNLTLSGTTIMEIDGTARGTAYDGVNLTGSASNTLTYSGELSLSFGAAITAGTYDLFQLGSVQQSGDFTSVSASGLGFVDTFTGLTFNGGTGWVANLTDTSANSWILTFSNATGDLSITPIPEPSAFASLAGLAAVGFAARRRRRG